MSVSVVVYNISLFSWVKCDESRAGELWQSLVWSLAASSAVVNLEMRSQRSTVQYNKYMYFLRTYAMIIKDWFNVENEIDT